MTPGREQACISRRDSGNDRRPRVAFVVQRCGEEVNGGAEAHCLAIAQQMAPEWQTEVLTTCALDYLTWANHYPPGDEECGGTTIRRFPVAVERDIKAFDALSATLIQKQRLCTMAEQRDWMHAQGPCSPGLTQFIKEHHTDYDAFFFFGYLYATTFDNLPLVADKAWLAPLTHDEWPLQFSMFDRLFSLPHGFVFNTGTERHFAADRFFHLNLAGPVVGVGIEPPPNLNPESFCKKFEIQSPFLLYCGRIDPSKGCDEMIDAFLHWKSERRVPHQLVLLGKAAMAVPASPHIRPLGFVSTRDRWDAMAACDWLVIPSRYESLSMVLLESWSVGRPALVNGRTPVLVDHCNRSNAGIPYGDWEEAAAAIELCSPDEKLQMGRNGQRYVSENYRWEVVRSKYRGLLPQHCSTH